MTEKRILVKNSKRVGIGLIAIIFVQMFMIITGNCDFITVSNAETFGDFEYTIDSENNTVEITKYKGSETEVTIPDTIEGKKVTSIEYKAFYGCRSLTSINIPEGVTSIGDWVFFGCSSITSINIPEGVTSIGVQAFYGCSSLTSINIPEGATSIGDYAFSECRSLRSINIPNSVASIGDGAFDRCSSMTSINIPEGATSIGDFAFSGCSSLTSINIPEGVTSIGMEAFYECSGLINIKIPEGITSIGSRAFYGCSSLTSVNIPEGVTSIGSVAFMDVNYIICSSSMQIQLPEIIRRTMIEDDILYSSEGFEFENCNLNEDKTMLLAADNIGENQEVSLKVKSGKLKGLTLKIVKSGTIIYNITNFTNKNVIAKILLEDGTNITNNNNKNYYVFEQNGEFTFEYTTSDGEKKTAKATVNNIDKEGPKVTITTEKTEQVNKLKVKLTANEAIKDIDVYELNVSNNFNVESYTLSEDEKELLILYANNAENDFKITDKFIVKDFLENESTVDLETKNIVVPTKVFKMTYKTTYQETKKGENTYISNISPNTTIAETINNLNTNGNITIYKKTKK